LTHLQVTQDGPSESILGGTGVKINSRPRWVRVYVLSTEEEMIDKKAEYEASKLNPETPLPLPISWHQERFEKFPRSTVPSARQLMTVFIMTLISLAL
jgi:hypothetical protein